MKKLIISLAVAAATLGVVSASFGQAAGPKGGAPGQGGFQRGPGGAGGPGGGRMGGGRRMQQMQKEIFAKLKLTPDQAKKLKALQDKQQAKMKSMRDSFMKPGADQQKLRDSFRATMQDYRKQVEAILTPAQRKQYETLMKEAREKFRAQRGTGKGQNPPK